MGKQVVAIVGSYRRGGNIDQAVEAILEGARERGAETTTLFLRDKHIEFCTNCRSCMQQRGPLRGACVLRDDMAAILDRIEQADSLVLASPVNCFDVTALFRRWLERLVVYGYWPWGQNAPTSRHTLYTQKTILVTSAAMPGPFIRWFTHAPRTLGNTARLLGARVVGTLWIGLAAHQPDALLRPAVREKARRLGRKLA